MYHRFLLHVHFICALAFSVFVLVFWERMLNAQYDVAKLTLRNASDEVLDRASVYDVCMPFVGCTIITGKNKCAGEPQRCSGSTRCCRDCARAHKSNALRNNTGSDVAFRDSHIFPILVSAVGLSVTQIVYIFTGVLGARLYHGYLNRVSRILSGLCLAVILIAIGALLTYIAGYTATSFESLRLCQTAFVAFVSWTWIYLLSFIDILSIVTPGVLRSIKGISNRISDHTMYSEPGAIYHTSFCRRIIEQILSLIASITLFWWPTIVVYFYGVYTKRWLIYF